MKKTALLAMIATVLFANCTNENMNVEEQTSSNLPATKVFIQGDLANAGAWTKAGLAWPYVSSEGWATARFSIRADGTLPGYIDQSSALYYGRPAGKNGKNRGRINVNYPYGHYNDRDLDYDKVDKKATDPSKIGLFRYIYDVKGLNTQRVLMEVPLVEDILADEVDDREAAIAAGKNVAANTAELAKVNALIAKGSEYLNSHVLWYVVKEVGMKDGWHVNGIISENVVGEPDNVPDDVEIDIHQQDHSDWSEIKTSVHVRADVSFVEINIPLAFEDIIEADDFNIRVFKDYYTDEEYNDVTVTITHNEKGITINISDINPEIIDNYKNEFGDGLTVEIHSYTKSDDQGEIWNQVKNSTVTKIGKPCTVNGQITNFFNDEKLPIKVLSPNGKK